MISGPESESAPDLATAKRRSLVENFFARACSPLLIVTRDLEVAKANAAATELTGLETGARVLDGFWSVSATAVMRVVDAARRRVDCLPVSVRTAHDRLVEVGAFALEHGGDELVGLIVTDRASVDEAHRRLKDQEARYRSLFEWAPVAMREDDFTDVGTWLDNLRAAGVTDLAAYLEEHPGEVRKAAESVKVIRVNQAMADLLGAPSTLAVVDAFCRLRLSDDIIGAFVDMFHALWQGRGEAETDFVGIDFSGHPFECRLRAIAPRTRNGYDLSRVVVAMLDLTELRAATRRLERLVADKDRFVASVSHELRTPLAAVFGVSEEVASNWDRFEPSELRELVGMIAQQSAELTAIVEDLLVAANLESGKVTINPEVVSLNSLANEAWSDCRRSLPELECHCISGPETSAVADPVRVRQIVRNLLTNAIRYGGEKVSIRVGADAPAFAEQVHPYLEVVDDGDGVALEHRESIFDPYFQPAGNGSVLGSLGLGLAISRELARRMGGDLTYAYRKGQSVFRLQVPGA